MLHRLPIGLAQAGNTFENLKNLKNEICQNKFFVSSKRNYKKVYSNAMNSIKV